MPTLKQLTCYVEWSASGSSLPLQEYGTIYFDGLVETYVQVPPISTPFSIRLKSDGYIAPGLSMFVYIDGEYQCNRGRNNLKIPTSTTQKHHTNVDFVVRQKEAPMSSGGFAGAQWTFGVPEGDTQGPIDYKGEYSGLIEVVVLRSHELQRPIAPDPSISEVHPLVFQTQANSSTVGDSGFRGTIPTSTSNPPLRDNPDAGALDPVEGSLSDYYGLFDGASDVKGYQQSKMPFGGDMTWDEEKRDRGPHFDRDWTSRSRDSQRYGNTNRQQNLEPPTQMGDLASNRGAGPAVVINVNQSPQEPSRSSVVGFGGSVVDSWNSTRHSLAGSALGNSGGQEVGKTGVDGWQSWENGVQQRGTPTQNGDWKSPESDHQQNSPNQSSSSGSPHSQNNVHNRDGWANGESAGWDNHENSNSQNRTGNGWDSHGQSSSNKNYEGNNDRHWSSGHDDGPNQGGWNSNEHKSEGGWNTEGDRGQNANGWNNSGYGKSNDDQYYNQDHNQGNVETYDQGIDKNHGESGNGWAGDWNNGNAGSKEQQASTGPGWDTSGQNQTGWGQGEPANDTFQATAGVSDPSKPRSRKATSVKAKSTRSNLSRQASINAAAQNSGWGPYNPIQEGVEGGTQFGQQRTEQPTWPSNNQPSPLSKPYYVFQDSAGNPKLHAMPLEPVHPRPPPPPAPVEPVKMSGRVQTGKPVLYQHKVASPKYLDTHDKPYAVFVFKYRTKYMLEQILKTTLPDSDDMAKAKLVHLSKEELIEQVLKTKSQMGSKANTFSVSSLTSAPASVNNPNRGGADNAGPGPSGYDFGAALNDKLAGLAAQNSSSSNSKKGKQASNHAPPGSPMAKNGHIHPNGPSNGHPSSPDQWWPQYASNGNAPPDNGAKQVESWRTKTPAGASASGHKPWSGDGGGSAQNSRKSNVGGDSGTRSWSGDRNNGTSWNNDNNGGQNGWNTNNGNESNGQTGQGWNEGNGNGGAGGWNGSHGQQAGNNDTQW
ncbi:MAG: hypothetical protein Q9220_003302 [cf. Caloplaca sp. 1 TL-2023]